MAYANIDLSDYISDFDDKELVEELKARGYFVGEREDDIVDIVDIERYWNRGDKKEALVLLERKFPELINISKLVD